MRALALATAVSGALALTSLAVPAAQADEIWDGGVSILDVTVNGGRPIVVGTTNEVTFTGSVTASDPDGIETAFLTVWHGTGEDDPDLVSLAPASNARTCTAVDSTTKKCTVTITVDPRDLTGNSYAGAWNVAVSAFDKASGGSSISKYKTAYVKRYSRLTVNASPEPVAKGKTLTVTGRLTRANWETHDYRGYVDQPVSLQFRKAGSSTYSTVKTVRTDSHGDLRTTVTASTDGYWRYSFAGTSTTAAVKATGDFVDVR
jgi:hypothetical protein